MAKRRRAKTKRALPIGTIVLWTLLVVETVWLAAFMVASRSVVPPLGVGALSADASRPGWTDEKQARLDELQIQQLLAEGGSRSDGGD